MKRFLKDYRLHEHTEALFLLTLGIIIQVLDGSPLDVKERWTLAWETEFPREYFTSFSQKIIKTVLSMIILVRCLTSVLYVLFGLTVAYSILKETSPKLMLPWLFISGLKSVLLTFLETLTGVYVCSTFGKIRKPCIEFVISKAVELFFAIYLWACIRSIHKDMEQFEENTKEEALLTRMVIHRVNLRRRRARSMVDETTLYKTANLNYFELKDVPNIIFDMLKTEEEMSQDSLISPGMMLASVSNMGSYDYLKTSLSLGELGFMDLNSFQVVGLDDDRHLCPYKRAMKFLKLTKDDIQNARERTRQASFTENYAVPKEISWDILNSKPSITLSRHLRQEEIFITQLPDPDKLKEVLKRKKKRKIPQDDILSDIDATSEKESRGSYEKIIGLEEGEDGRDDGSFTVSGETDGETTPDLWFMSNKKDEVNRISLFETHTSKRADNYERLYQQDFMSVIGPEVFDKASKLIKLTSLSDVNARSSGLADKSEAPLPGTSHDPDSILAEETELQEAKEQTKAPKIKKKIAFDDHYDTHTTMPLSIIVTKFPIKFDSEISKCEALYFSEDVSKGSGILFVPDSGEASSEKCDMSSIGNEASRGTEISVAGMVGEDEQSSLNHIYYPSKQPKNSLCKRKYSLFLLKYFRDTSSDLKNCRMDSRSHKRGKRKALALSKQDESKIPILKYSDLDSLFEEKLPRKKAGIIYPRIYEQILFIKDLMRRPIRDVLSSYYTLRQLDMKHSRPRVREICTGNNIRKSNRKASVGKANSECEKYLMMLAGLGKKSKNTSDHETQVYFNEKGLRSYASMETVFLGSPKTDKMDTSGNYELPPLYLFGNKDLGWSSRPVNVTDGNDAGNRSCDGEKDSEKESISISDKERDDISSRGSAPLDQNNSEEIIAKPSEPSNCSNESDESFSLFYSKTADLSSPLMDMSRFIYPDHIHYSYKNVNRKGFDIELNSRLPLLVRDSLTFSPPPAVQAIDSPPDAEKEIIRGPMNVNIQDSFDDFRSYEPVTSNVQTVTTDEKVCEISLVKMKKKSLPRYGTGDKKKQKWLKRFGKKEESSRDSGLRHGFVNEMVDPSSINLHRNIGRTGTNKPVTSLQTNKPCKKNLQGVHLQGCPSFYP